MADAATSVPATLPDGTVPVRYEDLAPAVQAKATSLIGSIDLHDSNAILSYGVEAQNEVSGIAEQMMGAVRVKDAGDVGVALADLVGKIRGAGVRDLTTPGGGIFGKLFNSLSAFISRYEKLDSEIDTIVRTLEKDKITLQRDIANLDALYTRNVEFVHELEAFIAAGQRKLEEVKAKDLAEFTARFAKTNDPMDAQAISDLQGAIDRFERKLHDLRLVRYIGIQTAPQIRTIQNNDAGLLEKVTTAINTTIPLWRRQAALLIAAYDTKRVAEVSNSVDDMTNKLIASGGSQIRQINADAAKANERGVVELESLKKADEEILAMLDDTIRIREEGRAMRAQAEKDLAEMETQLKAKLSASTGR
jgi:uncharacterized protein YaaN involved in tellurite resistance